MKIGYARVSTKEQNLELQINELKKQGCAEIHKEIASGAKSDRPVLNKVIENLRPGDALVIWKLDRLGRSLRHLVNLVNDLLNKEISIISVNDPIDTSSAQGKFAFNIFASLAEFERDLIKMRTKAGLDAALAKGKRGGRPKGLTKKAQEKAYAAETLYKEKKFSTRKLASHLGISRATLYSYLKFRNVPIGQENKTTSN
jgi:DNA invertase Pin-like site-specific DNA recombinase